MRPIHSGPTALLLVGILAACTNGVPDAPPPSRTPSTTASDSAQGIVASVRVVPAASAELGFLISAPVKEVLVMEGELVSAGAPLIRLDTPELEYGLKAAQAEYTAAEREEYIQSQGRRKLVGDKFLWVAGPPEQRQVARARVLQAEAQVAAAEAELEQSVLRAPFEGTVVSINAAPGEVVQPGQVVVILGDLTDMRLETTDLSERDVAHVRVGQRASIVLEAFDTGLLASVTAIEPVSGRSPDGEVTYTVRLIPDEQPAALRWGMTGDATIFLHPG